VLRSSFVIATYGSSTPHSSGFRAPCIWMFLTSLGENYFFNNLLVRAGQRSFRNEINFPDPRQ